MKRRNRTKTTPAAADRTSLPAANESPVSGLEIPTFDGHAMIEATFGELKDALWRPMIDPLSEFNATAACPVAMPRVLALVHRRLRQAVTEMMATVATRLGLPSLERGAIPLKPIDEDAWKESHLFKDAPERQDEFRAYEWHYRLRMEVLRYHFVREFASDPSGDVVVSGSWAPLAARHRPARLGVHRRHPAARDERDAARRARRAAELVLEGHAAAGERHASRGRPAVQSEQAAGAASEFGRNY